MRLQSIDRNRQHGPAAVAAQQGELQRLRQCYERFGQENAQQPNPPHCKLRIDAGFASSENLTQVIELGYDVETKSANPALLATLRSRINKQTVWTPVGKNAEMVAWLGYQTHTCPYPLSVGLERFHTPQGERQAVLLRYQDDVPSVGFDLTQWFHEYNGRQSIEMV